MNSTLNKIKELREKATQGEWTTTSYRGPYDCLDMKGDITYMIPQNAEYIVALHNAFPSLIQEHEALLRFVDELKKIDINYAVATVPHADGTPSPKCNKYMDRVSTALQALDKELKQ